MTMASRAASEALYRKALGVMAGGVSSPVRAFKAVGGTPVFFRKGRGSKLWDVDGNRYTDYVCSWGAIVLGHADREVAAEIARAARDGSSFGAPVEAEADLAEAIRSRMPSVEKVRFVNSGTEAVMSAVRVARGYASRKVAIRFEGCYHGHADMFLGRAGSGMATFDIPASLGVTEESTRHVLTVPYNDAEALERAAASVKGQLAAVVVEPVAGNMGTVPPEDGFLRRCREVCDGHGAALVFDEVITGFRVAPGGAQERYGVTPDMTCLGKIIGGGMPVGAFGGRSEMMERLAPEGRVYQAGTLAGNPVAMAAGLATLRRLDGGVYDRLEGVSSRLERGLLGAAEGAGVPLSVNRVGSMVGVFFSAERVKDYSQARKTKHGLFPGFFHGMLERGSYLPPSPFETIFLTASHTAADVASTAEAAAEALGTMKRGVPYVKAVH